MAEKKIIKIKYVRSVIGRPAAQRKVLKGLGLSKLNQFVERIDTPEIRGMIIKISHLVKVVEERGRS